MFAKMRQLSLKSPHQGSNPLAAYNQVTNLEFQDNCMHAYYGTQPELYQKHKERQKLDVHCLIIPAEQCMSIQLV